MIFYRCFTCMWIWVLLMLHVSMISTDTSCVCGCEFLPILHVLVNVSFTDSVRLHCRYQFFLQLKQDVLAGKLEVSEFQTLVEMCALAVQCEYLRLIPQSHYACGHFVTTKYRWSQNGHRMVASGRWPPANHFRRKEVAAAAPTTSLRPKWSLIIFIVWRPVDDQWNFGCKVGAIGQKQ